MEQIAIIFLLKWVFGISAIILVAGYIITRAIRFYCQEIHFLDDYSDKRVKAIIEFQLNEKKLL
jgi:hypothetical protein